MVGVVGVAGRIFRLGLLGYTIWCFYPCEKKGRLLAVLTAVGLYGNFRFLTYFFVNSITEGIWSILTRPLLTVADPKAFIDEKAALLQVILELLWVAFLVTELLPLKWIIKKKEGLSLTEGCFLSVLNVAGILLSYVMIHLAILPTKETVVVITEEKPALLWQMPVIALLLYLGEMAVLAFWQKTVRLKEQEEMYFVEKVEKDAIKQRLEDMEQYYEQIRRVRHDMSNHVMTMAGLLAKGEDEVLAAYFSKLTESMEAVKMRFYTGNPVTDVVINDKASKAERQGISFSSSCFFRADWGISMYDISVILCNLLDNAIRAAAAPEMAAKESAVTPEMAAKEPAVTPEIAAEEPLTARESVVSIRTTEKGQIVCITCCNTVSGADSQRKSCAPGEELFSDKGWKATRAGNHGLGLKNVEAIARRYQGSLQITKDTEMFTITVMLKKPSVTI